MTDTPRVLGIDYSVTCPACCLVDGGVSRWWVHYKLSGRPYRPLPGVSWTPSTTTEEIPRFIELSEWVAEIVKDVTPTLIVLEDYAFGGSGRITQLSENAGALKVKLFQTFPAIPLFLLAPTTMKKFATGRGIATKDEVWAAFVKQEPDRAFWAAHCHPKARKITSPTADIADSYFLAQYGRTHFWNPETHHSNA